MSVTTLHSFKPNQLQTCPMCGQQQPIYLRGTVKCIETGANVVHPNKGYSFCNCHNIWFTNIDWDKLKTTYDEDYAKKYEPYAKMFFDCATAYGDKFKEFGVTGGRLLDVGPASTVVMGAFSGLGFDTACVDFIEHNVLNSYIGSFDTMETDNLVEGGYYSVVWASHVFEHFMSPDGAMLNFNDCLEMEGLLFVAMPDPWQINWKSPYQWEHWHTEEHHILWDMDSFIKYAEKFGFECVYKYRNCSQKFVTNGDYHLIFRKVKCVI